VPTESKISFNYPLDGMQKLSFALLVPLLAIFIFSLYKIHNINKRIDDIPVELEELSQATTKIKREIDIVGSLKDNLKRSSERHIELLKVADVRTQTSVNLEGLDTWRSDAGLHRTQLKQDLDRLQQFNAEKNIQLNEMTILLKKLLLQEDAQWRSLQQFLEKQADKAVNSEEMEQYFQNYIKEFLHTIRALGAYQGSINELEEKLRASVNKKYLKSKDLGTESERLKDSLLHHLILVTVSLVVIVIASCGAYGLRIRRERRSRDRRSNDRSSGYTRRKSDRP
jgi:hypothetical protein